MTTTATGVVLVTGAGQRIGRAIALALGEAGWSVAVHYQSSAKAADEVASLIAKTGGTAASFRADLSQESETQRLIPQVAEALGPVTCLVNNASVFERDTADTVTRESWDQHMEVNLRAPLVLSQQLAAQLPKSTPGNIVNLLDERVFRLTPGFTSYTVSRMGLWTLTQTLAQAWAPHIRVNAIGPGPTLPSPRQSQEDFDRQVATLPLKQGATPDEIGRAVLFLLDSPSVTGQMIAMDGGQHLAWQTPDVVGMVE